MEGSKISTISRETIPYVTTRSEKKVTLIEMYNW